MDNNVKRYSTSLVIRAMQIENPMRYHSPIIKNGYNLKAWQYQILAFVKQVEFLDVATPVKRDDSFVLFFKFVLFCFPPWHLPKKSVHTTACT